MPEKGELPLREDAEIERLVSAFEARTLPCEAWTHRAHLAVAITYIRRYGYPRALTELRRTITAYNLACGKPGGYSETITMLFLRKVAAESKHDRCLVSLPAELARLEALCGVEWMYRYYSRALIWSSEARRQWVEPDLLELDFEADS